MSDKLICTHGEWPCNFFTRHNSEYTNESGLTACASPDGDGFCDLTDSVMIRSGAGACYAQRGVFIELSNSFTFD
jgi:hypothetical protein